MASRRDLIQAYQFASRRVVSAVVARDGDPDEWPMRRIGGSGFVGVMLTVVALAAVGVYGLVSPGGKTSWRDGRSIIVEAETGARYVYVDRRLHPVLNFASAALLVGSPAVTRAHHRSLAGVPRGVELGIPGAPDALPKASGLLGSGWSMCSEQVRDATGRPVARTALVLAGAAGGQTPGDRALLVTEAETGTWHLIWHDHRYRIVDRDVVGAAIGLHEQVNVAVGAAWLQALPAGDPIGPIAVAGAGRRSTLVPGATTGQVLVVADGPSARSSYLVTADELVPLTELQAQIQRAVAGAPPAQTVPSSAVSAARKGQAAGTGPQQAPFAVPTFLRPRSTEAAVCAAYSDGSFTPAVSVDARIPGAGDGTATTRVTTDGVPLADRVSVPAGRAALVAAVPSAQAGAGPLYLVSEVGKRFAVPGDDVLGALGYTGARVLRLPASLVVRIPEGAVLDPAAARTALAGRPGG